MNVIRKWFSTYNVGDVLKWTWELPQNIIGALFMVYIDMTDKSYFKFNSCNEMRNTQVFCDIKGGVTLGRYIFLNKRYYTNNSVITHEIGHIWQSIYLGPLYLIVVGLPSVFHAWLNNYIRCCYFHDKENNLFYCYYHFYTERWANNIMIRKGYYNYIMKEKQRRLA